MSRFYVPKQNIGDKFITIDGDEAHHVIDVMRLDEGDVVVVFDGTGYEYSGPIKKIDPREKKVVVEISKKEERSAACGVRVTLIQSIPKKGKMDLVVEKAAELGVHKIVPIVTARTIVRPDDDSSQKKVQRWRKIALEASKQCGRADVCEVSDVISFDRSLELVSEHDLTIFAWLHESTISLADALSGFKEGRVLVFIGPEGDFTPDEAGKVLAIDTVKAVSLGRRVFRSETAGLYTLSVLGYLYGL
ncbi:MAG: 16S rRNA (uracil(1498)-N(3))-methyltransferase [Candidatus Omnitrophica bacterium]|nr:16S rRNA (uracil(1498)-N(3))-methyltransferase [Candidatus Omnitrophota bacterium]